MDMYPFVLFPASYPSDMARHRTADRHRCHDCPSASSSSSFSFSSALSPSSSSSSSFSFSSFSSSSCYSSSSITWIKASKFLTGHLSIRGNKWATVSNSCQTAPSDGAGGHHWRSEAMFRLFRFCFAALSQLADVFIELLLLGRDSLRMGFKPWPCWLHPLRALTHSHSLLTHSTHPPTYMQTHSDTLTQTHSTLPIENGATLRRYAHPVSPILQFIHQIFFWFNSPFWLNEIERELRKQESAIDCQGLAMATFLTYALAAESKLSTKIHERSTKTAPPLPVRTPCVARKALRLRGRKLTSHYSLTLAPSQPPHSRLPLPPIPPTPPTPPTPPRCTSLPLHLALTSATIIKIIRIRLIDIQIDTLISE